MSSPPWSVPVGFVFDEAPVCGMISMPLAGRHADADPSLPHCLQLPSSKKIRLAYMGKMLRENATLGVQGWKSGHILNALVFPQ